MNGYDRNMRKLGSTTSATEMIPESIEMKAKREHAAKRARLERELVSLARATSKMAECVEVLVGGDRVVLTTAVKTTGKSFDEMIRTFNVLSKLYETEKENGINQH